MRHVRVVLARLAVDRAALSASVGSARAVVASPQEAAAIIARSEEEEMARSVVTVLTAAGVQLLVLQDLVPPLLEQLCKGQEHHTDT